MITLSWEVRRSLTSSDQPWQLAKCCVTMVTREIVAVRETHHNNPSAGHEMKTFRQQAALGGFGC